MTTSSAEDLQAVRDLYTAIGAFGALLVFLIVAGTICAIIKLRRRRRNSKAEEPEWDQPHQAEASGATFHLAAQSAPGDDHDDDVIGPGHPLYPMMMQAMQGNIVTGERDEDGTVTITGSTPLQ